VFDTKQKNEVIRPQILEMSKKIRHRGPDWSGIYQHDNVIFSHERLAIVDPTSGNNHYLQKIKKWLWLLMVRYIIIRS
jgi:asparagine synthase (glutamine-hydrolysing)